MCSNKCIVFAVNKLLIKSCREREGEGDFAVPDVVKKRVICPPSFNEVQTQ